MGVWRGGDTVGLYIKDKFLDDVEGGKMGSWGITMRQSDYGLDLLGTIIDTRLKTVNFLSFHVADALEFIKAVIIKEIIHSRLLCGKPGFLFQRDLPPQFYPGGAADCGVSCRLLPYWRACRI